MDMKEIEIFDGKTLADLFQEIHSNSVEKRNKMVSLIEDIRPLIKNTNDAMLLVPIIKEYMDVSVRNDENLIKLAMVIQRIIVKQTEIGASNEFGLSEDEKNKLINQAEEFYNNIMKESDLNKNISVSGSKVNS